MNARPFRYFTFQCDMDRAKGLDIENTYITVNAADQFTHFISEVVRNEIAVDLNKTPYLSVIIDGATDSSVKIARVSVCAACNWWSHKNYLYRDIKR